MPKRVGRPKADVETEMLAVRIPVDLGHQLNRYLDRLETRVGVKTNRASIARHALKLFLDAQDQEAQEATSAQRPPILPVQPPAQPKRLQFQRGSTIRVRIMELLKQYPEGLTPIETKEKLNESKDLRHTLRHMEQDDGLLKRLDNGCYALAD